MKDTIIIFTEVIQEFDYNTNKYLTIGKVTKTITDEV